MQLSNIDASLSHGLFVAGKKMSFLCFATSLLLLLPLLTIIMLIIPGIEWERKMIIALVMGNLLFISLFILIINLIAGYKKLEKKVVLWLEDAIRLRALTMRLDKVSLAYKPFQIQVNFEFDGRMYQRVSAPGNVIKGYHKIFSRYGDREINILYSPKYDEVLIIKDCMTDNGNK